MSANKSISDKEFKEDLAFFADEIAYIETHDIGDELEAMPEVHFEISPRLRRKRYPLDDELSENLVNIASQRGIPTEALLNRWVREKIIESTTDDTAK